VSPSWVAGTAVERVLVNPLARPGWLREMLLGLPGTALHLATWGGLGLELAFAPLAIIRRTRPWIWAAMLAMHRSLTPLIDFADLSFGMVMLHLFTFDPAWVRPRAGAGDDLLRRALRCLPRVRPLGDLGRPLGGDLPVRAARVESPSRAHVFPAFTHTLGPPRLRPAGAPP